MIERRRPIRRAVCGGIMLGAVAGLLLALLEIAAVALLTRGSSAALVKFAAYAIPLLLLCGALTGAPVGLASVAISSAAERLGSRKSAARVWTARLYTATVTPAIALCAALTFRGRYASTLPYKDLLAAALGLFAVALFHVAARIAVSSKEKMGHGLVSRGGAAVRAALLFAVVVALYLADQKILPRLYLFFHVALAVSAFAAAELAVGAAYLAVRPYRPRIRRLADPSFALVTLLAAGAAGLGALVGFCDADDVRAVAFERGVLVPKVLRVASALGVQAQSFHVGPAARSLFEVDPSQLPVGPVVKDADIFLITVDALRADHTGVYGYGRATTPNLDEEARRGVLFERAYAQVPHTSFSLGTLLVSRYLYSLAALGDVERHESMADVLRRAGYKTAAFYPPAVFYIEQKKMAAYEKTHFGFEYVKYEYMDAEQRVDQILDYLKEVKPTRTFVWVHFFEPHEPYDPRPGISFGREAIDRYDAEVAYTDRAVGRLLAEIHRQRPRAIVAVTADHGEEFGEHGGRYHGTSLYDEQVRVPLFLTGPTLPVQRIHGPVELIDVPQTLLGLVGAAPLRGGRGTNLGPWLAGADEALLPPVFAELETKKMVIAEQRKLICDIGQGFCQLYDLQADPKEQKNEVELQPERRAKLQGLLEAWMGSHSPSAGDEVALPDKARLLERARLGDRTTTSTLASLLADPDRQIRAQAAYLLGRLPPDLETREPLAQALGDGAAGDWAAVALGNLCDPRAYPRLTKIGTHSDEWVARAGLALGACKQPGAAEMLTRGLRADDVQLRRAVILALGRLRDPALVPLLVSELPSVLERQEVVQALGRIGSERAIGPLGKLLHEDPYAHVRQEAARSLANIGGRQAIEALRASLAEEEEPAVQGSLIAALWRCGALPGAIRGGHGDVTLARGELWVGRIPGETAPLEVKRPPEARKQEAQSEPTRDVFRFALPPGRWNVEVSGPVAFLFPR